MKAPENMDSTDLCPDGPSDEDYRRSVSDWLDDPPADFDAADFFECYIDPAGPFRYCGSFDAWSGIRQLVQDDPRMMAERLREWVKDGGG